MRVTEQQSLLLRELLDAVKQSNPFYQPKLRGLHKFSALPFTVKSEIIEDQLKHPPFGSNLTFPIEQYTRFSQTSATTGRPMRWLDTPATWSWMLDNWKRVFEAAGVHAGDRVFFAFSFGPFLGFWTAYESAARMGCLCIPGGGMRSGARLRTLIDAQASVLCCTPTYAVHLAEAAGEENIDLANARIRAIIVAGEPGGSIPGTRRMIEQLWNGASVIDHHGMTEVGPVTYGCPAHPNVLHVIEASYIAEVIDPLTTAAVAPGVSGELVLTTLGRIGSPLIRYRTGDIVRPSPDHQCECGTSDLSLEGGILGRTDEMIVVRGVNVYPSAVEDVIRNCGGVAEYRVCVGQHHSMAELSIEVEADDPALPARIEVALRNALALRIPVRLVGAGTLPRFEMKARRWIR